MLTSTSNITIGIFSLLWVSFQAPHAMAACPGNTVDISPRVRKPVLPSWNPANPFVPHGSREQTTLPDLDPELENTVDQVLLKKNPSQPCVDRSLRAELLAFTEQMRKRVRGTRSKNTESLAALTTSNLEFLNSIKKRRPEWQAKAKALKQTVTLTLTGIPSAVVTTAPNSATVVRMTHQLVEPSPAAIPEEDLNQALVVYSENRKLRGLSQGKIVRAEGTDVKPVSYLFEDPYSADLLSLMKAKPLTEHQALNFVRDIALGLVAMHSTLHRTHGNIAPQSILIRETRKGKEALLGHFEFSRGLEDPISNFCTRGYEAPEMVSGVTPLQTKNGMELRLFQSRDLYALAILTLELLRKSEKSPFFEIKTPADQCRSSFTGWESWKTSYGVCIVAAGPPFKKDLSDRIKSYCTKNACQFEQLLAKALDSNPRQRPTAEAFTAVLQLKLQAMSSLPRT